MLDFGGGVGATGAALVERGIAIEAVLFDQVAGLPAQGISNAEAVDLEDLAKVGDLLERLGPFDTILALDVLEHLRDPWLTFELLAASLRPGGAMILSLPNVNYIGLVAPLVLRGRFDYVDAGVLDRTHLRWFTRHSMIELAAGPGLILERIEPAIPGRLKRTINAVTLGLFERFFAAQYRLRVRKV